MPAVEFVESPDDEPPPARHRRAAGPLAGARRRRALLLGAAAFAASLAVGVVVAQRPASRPAAGGVTHVSMSPSSSVPAPSPSTLALPEQLAFGPRTQSLLVRGSLVYGLTAQLVAVVQRDGGRLVVRPTPLGLAAAGTPTLLLDQRYSILWTVAVGGTSVGSYDSEQLSSRDDQVAPAPIRAAAAYGGQLWFVTAGGLYRLAPGLPSAVRVARAPGLRGLAADPSRHRMLVVSTTHVTAYSLRGRAGTPVQLPFAAADGITVVDGDIWASGHLGTDGLFFRLDPNDLQAHSPPVAGATGAPRFLAAYRNRLVVTGPPGTMRCLRTDTGAVLQTWPYRTGAVALNDRGLLLSEGIGIELRAARDCLAG